MSVALWFVMERRLPVGLSNPRLFLFAALAGAFGPFISRTALMYALKYIPPTRTTLIALLTPGLTLLPAFLAFGSVPTRREVVGGLIIVAGVAIPLLERAQSAQSEPLPEPR